MNKRLSSALAVLLVAQAALFGCSLGEEPAAPVAAGSLAAAGDLSGVRITVGGKEFTEQLVLCEVTAKALQSAGAEVRRSCGLSGSNSARAALTSGAIDLYWEYTGTGWITHLGETTPVDDPGRLYEAVAAGDKARNGIEWLKPAPANNTYAVAASREKAEELRVTTLSEYSALAQRAPQQAGFCGAAEFFGRDDGWPGLQKAYGFTLPGSATSELATGAVYNAIDKAEPCAFGEVFATDGRIKALDLVVLKDDKRFFTAYNPSVSIRADVLGKNPKIADVLAPLATALTDETLQELNARVDVNGGTAEDTAQKWLQEGGFIGRG